MTTALTKLYMYFGVIGIASTLTWASCWLAAILFARSRRRTQVLWIVLVIAMIGLALAKVNSIKVSAIKLDQTEEIEAGRRRAAELIQMEEEDEEEEDIDEDESVYAQAAVGTTAPYAYRSRGKQTRDEGNRREDADAVGGLIETVKDAEERMMKAPDKNRANLLDRLNLFSARATMWLAIIFVLFDYLSRFNTTFRTYLPLPISCRFLDAVFPKAGSICIHEADAYTLAQYLQTAVVKGDTFVYFGDNDPWADSKDQGPTTRTALPRLCMPKLEKLRCADGTHHGTDFVFESVWFRRFCVVAIGEEFSTRWLHDLIAFLTLRHDVLAVARHTIHVVWHHAAPPPPDVVDKLLFLCQETNCSFVLIASTGQQPDAESQFAEVHTAPPSMPIIPRVMPLHRQLTQSAFQLRLNEIEVSRETALKKRIAREADREAVRKKKAARPKSEKASVQEKGPEPAPTPEPVAEKPVVPAKSTEAVKDRVAAPEPEPRKTPVQTGPEPMAPIAKQPTETDSSPAAPQKSSRVVTRRVPEVEDITPEPPKAPADKASVKRDLARRIAEKKAAKEEAKRLAKEKAKAQLDAARQRTASAKTPPAAEPVEPPTPSPAPATPTPSAPEQTTPITPPEAAAPATPPKPKPEPSRPAVTPPAPSGAKGKDLARRIADKKAAKLEAQRLAKEKAKAQIAAARERAKAKKEEPTIPEQKIAAKSQHPALEAPQPAPSQPEPQTMPQPKRATQPPSESSTEQPDQPQQSFFFQCPSCQQKIAAEPTWIGQTSACPTCGKAITIPDPNAPAPQSPEPTQAPAEPQPREFKFMCPGCDQKLSADPNWAGMQLECPKCGKGLIVPPPPPD